MSTFVLVHGAWHGGWCWRRVAHRLRAAGHEVFTPTLTGLGERWHMAGPMVGVNLHVEDIVNVLRFEGLEDVVLCGHSYAGMVIAGVAGLAPERLRTLVYLDAYLPRDGQCVLDLRSKEANRATLEQVGTTGGGWRMTPPSAGERFRVQSEEDRRWVDGLLTEMAFRAYTEPLRIQRIWEGRRVYVRSESYPWPPFDELYSRLAGDPGWEVHRLAGGHDLMIDNPEGLTRILLSGRCSIDFRSAPAPGQRPDNESCPGSMPGGPA